ncbi:hypothetical protein [Halorussus pelagicus]|uniref:hypothetical protein n=1 Tax=Halorussus pelagicus TaxID=2505977 RepID=UPI000FFC605C|nr:hypothetical protein [Halorussus pelagicus]
MITLGNVSHANQRSPTNFLTCHKKGELKSIGIANGMNTHYFDVEINGNQIIRPDGVPDIRFHSSQTHGGGEGNNGLSLNCEFDNLKIDIWDGKAPASEPRYWCIFEIDGAHLSMDQEEFMDKWNDEEEDDLLTIDDEDFVYLHYHDEDGSDILTAYQGRSQHAWVSVENDAFHPKHEIKNLSGKIFCSDWQGNPIAVQEDLFPLELRYASHETVLDTLQIERKEIETGVYDFEVELPQYVKERSASWTLSTQGSEWANYRDKFTVI